MKGLRFAGRVAIVVSAGMSIGSAVYHLSQGNRAAASLDVADFFTLGGASYVTDKAVEVVHGIDEGIKAGHAIREWNDAGGVPPPLRPKGTQQEKMEREFKQQENRMKHPFGF